MSIDRKIVETVTRTGFGRAALVTLVSLTGSGYQKAGARMLVQEDGASVGSVTGGCLERTVLQYALEAIERSNRLVFSVDTLSDSDSIFGYGLGCAGRLRLLVEPFERDRRPLALDLAVRMTGRREAVVIATSLEQHASPHAVVVDDSALSGSLNVIRSILWPDGAMREAFLERVEPAPHLLVFGAGNDAMPLAEVATSAGWEITLVDHRAAWGTSARFPGVANIVHARPEELELLHIPHDERTAAVLVTHNLLLDLEYARALLETRVASIGVVGSKKRFAWLEQELAKAGLDTGRLKGPAGIDIAAHSPREIALAIVAESTAALNGRRMRTSSAGVASTLRVAAVRCSG